VTLHDEIKIQTKQILDDVFNRRGISTEIVEKALLERHNKGVEMAEMEAITGWHSFDCYRNEKEICERIAGNIRALKEK